MTRASMTEVMTAQYIRTARLKGVKFSDIVLKHALRNALIAPFAWSFSLCRFGSR